MSKPNDLELAAARVARACVALTEAASAELKAVNGDRGALTVVALRVAEANQVLQTCAKASQESTDFMMAEVLKAQTAAS